MNSREPLCNSQGLCDFSGLNENEIREFVRTHREEPVNVYVRNWEASLRRKHIWLHRVRRVAERQLLAAKGQSLAEYALILALVAVVVIVALVFLGAQISALLQQVGESV